MNSNEYMLIHSKNYVKNTSIPRFVLTIENNISYNAFHYGTSCTIQTLSSNRVSKLERWSYIDKSLQYLKNLENLEVDSKKIVLSGIVESMGVTFVEENQYSKDTLVLTYEYFVLARSTYKRPRQDFQLPSISTLAKMTSNVKVIDDLDYMNNIFSSILDDRQKLCDLLLHEVYVIPCLKYHGGIVFAKAVFYPTKVANTILSFLVF